MAGLGSRAEGVGARFGSVNGTGSGRFAQKYRRYFRGLRPTTRGDGTSDAIERRQELVRRIGSFGASADVGQFYSIT
jgi:hypothetical protein